MAKGKIAFITDSTAYLTDELRNHPDVYIVPMIIISEGEQYEDGVDLSADELYDIIRKNKEVPKTSQPSVGKFVELYEMLKSDYDQAIAIHVSHKLSGTISSSAAAKEQVGFDVEIVDARSLSFTITELLTKGLQLVEKNLDVSKIANELRNQVTTSKNLILLGKLDQLYKGGRMSGAQFLLGNLLQIKPILSINNEGELELYERVRSEKKATAKIVELIKQSSESTSVKQVGIMHGNELQKALELKDMIKETLPQLNIVIGEISSSLAVHAGEGSLAVFWHEEKS
ncbi:DegV family protein [Bacillus sp. HMF5848]|uniref:DegV family protein n=1 Tax=Bacillus sp. HMF5848 TaxID=2495421 RepID=UPI000F782167|nr:DegV family protein [Bacillus sp. HMF5848]RSK26125.1 DegV family protein [Bacillus sp. HMF5848]